MTPQNRSTTGWIKYDPLKIIVQPGGLNMDIGLIKYDPLKILVQPGGSNMAFLDRIMQTQDIHYTISLVITMSLFHVMSSLYLRPKTDR